MDGSTVHRTIRVDGLGDEFDALIKTLPETIFGAPDEAWCEARLSSDPFSVLNELRDREGAVVRRDAQGLYGGVALPDPNGHDME